MPLNMVLYTRVSRDPLKRRESTNQQEGELRDVGDVEDWNVLRVFSDPDRSASEFARKERRGFLDLEDYVNRTPGVDGVAIWEASRIARSMSVGIAFRDMCQRLGLKIWFGGSYYDMRNADHRKQFTDALVDAEHESAKTSKRVQRDVRKRARDGRPHGKQVFGYTRVYDPETRELVEVVENTEQATLLRRMADRVLNGESCYSIARDLTARGVPSPHGTTWHPTNVSRLLKNPVYIGKRVLNGVVVSDGIWTPVFDEVTWARLQALLGDPLRKTRRDGAVKHLLTGVATCGRCGGKIGLMKQRGGYLAYICHGRERTPENPSPRRFCVARKQEDVDSFVERTVIAVLSRPDAVSELVRQDDDHELMSALADKITTLQARLEGFYDSAAAGDLTPSGLARIEPQLVAELEALERQRGRLHTPSVLRAVDLEHIADQWDHWPLHTRRAVLRELFDVRIMPTGRGRRSFDPRTVLVRPAGLADEATTADAV